jgi:hypothetical protein
MEQIRNVKLDNICEGIAEERGTMNAAKQQETGLIQSALQVMTGKGIQVYKHGGVELARVPGAEKLRVRLTKETGDADESDLEPAEAEEEEDDTADNEAEEFNADEA